MAGTAPLVPWPGTFVGCDGGWSTGTLLPPDPPPEPGSVACGGC